MELKDTIELMNSSDYKERFKAEYLQVKIRYDKLHKMPFGFSYQTIIGNDTENNSHGYKIHE